MKTPKLELISYEGDDEIGIFINGQPFILEIESTSFIHPITNEEVDGEPIIKIPEHLPSEWKQTIEEFVKSVI